MPGSFRVEGLGSVSSRRGLLGGKERHLTCSVGDTRSKSEVDSIATVQGSCTCRSAVDFLRASALMSQL